MANITGTANDDILPGTTLDDFINGLGGRDTITAGDGKDIIIGGLGADTIFAGNGDDEIWGGGGEWAAGEVIDGGAGNNGLYTWGGDISNVTLTNVQTLGTHLNTLSLKASQLAAFSALIAYDGPLMLQATEAGTYSLQGKSVTGTFSITGSSGNDYLAGNGAAQTLSGGLGNDRLQGLGGADILLGGDGDDEFLTGFTESPAGETIDGGAGFNTISSWNVDLSNATVSNVQKLNAALDRVTLTAAQLAGFTTLTTGSPQIDLIAAGAGTYSLQGKSVTGKFNLIGSTGNDYLAGNGAAQTLTGGNGNDVLQGAGGADVMLGGDGNDEFLTGFNESVNETIDGGAGNNTLSSWNADLSTTTISNIQTLGLHLDRVTLTAAQFNSFGVFNGIIAYDGPFTIYAATPGIYFVNRISDSQDYTFVGSSGVDWISDVVGKPAPTTHRTFRTGDGNDILQLGTDHDTVYAGGGNDTIEYTGGIDQLYGEEGDDSFELRQQYYSDNFTIDGGSGFNTLSVYGENADISSASISNIQQLNIYAQSVTLTAEQLNSFSNISANNGSFTIHAAAPGTYRLYPVINAPNYSFVGTGGNDKVLDSSTDLFPASNRTISTGAGDDLLLLGTDNDTIYAGSGNDVIHYGGGADEMYGEDGDDGFTVSAAPPFYSDNYTIDGGSGYNTITSAGDDISSASISNIQELYVLFGGVTLTQAQLASFQTVTAVDGTATINFASIVNTQNLPYFYNTNFAGDFHIHASSFNDTIYGIAAISLIDGADGDDYIEAFNPPYESDSQVLIGGTGNDTLFVTGSRYVFADGSDGNDTIYSYSPYDNTLQGGTGDDVFNLSASLFTRHTIDGGSGHDVIDLEGTDYGVGLLAIESTVTNIEEVRFSFWSATIGTKTFAPGTLFVSTSGSTFLTIGGNGVFDLSQYNVTGQFNMQTGFEYSEDPNYTYTLTLIGNDDAQSMHGDFSRIGSVTLYGRGGDDNLYSAGTMYGEEGNDTLNSFSGTDTLVGGTGDDLYYIGFTDPNPVQATIIENDVDVGNYDVLDFYDGAGINHDQLWFTRTGDDLVIRSIGTSNSCTIEDWYLGGAQHVEEIKSGDGKILLDSQVQNLVNAMAAFTVPTTTTLPPEYHAVLDPVLAANWT